MVSHTLMFVVIMSFMLSTNLNIVWILLSFIIAVRSLLKFFYLQNLEMLPIGKTQI